jgi:integrase
MASLQKVNGYFHISFRCAGQRFKRSLKTKSHSRAIARKARLEETIHLVECGRLHVPSDVDHAAFLLSDGKTNEKKEVGGTAVATPPLSLKSVFDAFFAAIPDGNLEQNTLDGMHQHKRHLLRILGSEAPFRALNREHLQRYVNRRCKEDTHYDRKLEDGSIGKTKVTAATIHKELVTLGTVWRWGEPMGFVVGTFPRRGLRLPKTTELPSFQTWDEILRNIEQDELDEFDATLFWDALYLRRSEIDGLLEHVRQHAAHPFIYPMFVMAAHTGARRSELLRCRKSDFDFDGDVLTIRERKRVKHRNTTRRVPLSPTLRCVMDRWINHEHPGGPLTFCHAGTVARSRSRSRRGDPITSDQVHDHFERTLQGSKWEKIKGWHCLRHSFISNLASQGVDQRIIDDFVGHTTEQMRRRYRHLFPDVKRDAIEKVFG